MRRVLALVLCLLAAPAVAREGHALLIGVTTYPNLPQDDWLTGPGNDVRLLRDFLLQAPEPFAPGNIAVLAEGDDADALPTLAAIRAGLADLAERVEPGDRVWLYFAGHGAQAPEMVAGSEQDGLDEIFLPRDVGQWDGGAGHVVGALSDDEIGAAIDAMRAKGADVWAIFDACHSATATRALPGLDLDAPRPRRITPATLGIPAAVPVVSYAPPLDLAADLPGRLTAFYAAQGNEVTSEMNLPRGAPGRKPHGVFTYSLLQVLAQAPRASFAQIGEEVLRRYAVENLALTTPMFEGDLTAAPFGAGEATPNQWRATVESGGMTLPAGSLHGLSVGDELALLTRATDATSRAIGRMRVVEVTAFSSRLEPVGEIATPLPAGPILRRLQSDPPLSLTLALPDGFADAAALQTAFGPGLHLVAKDAPADLRLAALPDEPETLRLLPGTGVWDAETPPPPLPGDLTAQALAETLRPLARALTLKRLAGEIGPGKTGVEVGFLAGPRGALQALSPLTMARVTAGEELHISARNTGAGPVDLNVLYIGADGVISHWFAGRLLPGDHLQRGLLAIGAASTGAEMALAVLIPAAPQSPVESLAFLARPTQPSLREVTGALSARFAAAGFGMPLTRVLPAEDMAPGVVMQSLMVGAAP